MVRPVVDGLAHRHHVSVAEVDHHDTWQRCALGWAVVASDVGHAETVADATERFVWSFPEFDVLSVERYWPELD